MLCQHLQQTLLVFFSVEIRQANNAKLQVKDSDMSKEVLEDYAASLEYASAERLLKMKKRGDQRLYLVK